MLDTWSLDIKLKKFENYIVEQEVTVSNLKKYLKDSEDIIYKKVTINGKKEITATFVFIEGMINSTVINNYILKPFEQEEIFKKIENQKELIKSITDNSVYFLSQSPVKVLKDAISDVLSGNTILVLDEEKTAISFETKGFEKRSISEPLDENVLKGSKDSFIEVMKVNNTLIRRKIKTHDLRIEGQEVGEISRTSISIIYLESLVDKKILNSVKQKIQNITVGNIVSTAYFEDQMKDKKYSLFPQFIYTERPDKACANIMEGRIVVIIDGFPLAYIMPVTLPMFFQAPEDYSSNYIVGSFVRIVRYICLILGLFLPAIYIAVVTFHQDMIPISLADSIIKSKVDVPFSAFTETIFMLSSFEVLLEAGIRMPKAIGQTTSIIGGLIIGEAAVSAKFLSHAVVVVVAAAGISGFLAPNQDIGNAIRICRFAMIFAAYALGLTGVYLGAIILIYYLSTISTFGVPYLSPISGNNSKNLWKDTLFRLPLTEGKWKK